MPKWGARKNEIETINEKIITKNFQCDYIHWIPNVVNTKKSDTWVHQIKISENQKQIYHLCRIQRKSIHFKGSNNNLENWLLNRNKVNQKTMDKGFKVLPHNFWYQHRILYPMNLYFETEKVNKSQIITWNLHWACLY